MTEQQRVKKRERIIKSLPTPVDVPTDPNRIRTLCAYWYMSSDPGFKGIREAVDHFIKEILSRLEKRGHDREPTATIVKDMVILGVAGLRIPAWEKKGESTDKAPHFSHHFAVKREDLYGSPLIAKHLEDMAALSAAVDYNRTEPEDAKYQPLMTVLAEKLLKIVVKSLSKPIGGAALRAYDQEVDEYRKAVSWGWASLTRFRKHLINRSRKGGKRRAPQNKVAKTRKPEAPTLTKEPPQASDTVPATQEQARQV